jgi:hypothetical protein
VTFLYHTLFVYEKKLREKSNFRQSLIIGTLGTTEKEYYSKQRSFSSREYLSNA